MSAVYAWDVFSTLDGYGSFTEGADWGGYWSKQGPELLEHRASLFDTDQRMVYGATPFQEVAEILSRTPRAIWSSGRSGRRASPSSPSVTPTLRRASCSRSGAPRL
ncbi:hypothetical protein [Microbacterium sp. 4R-513]|uniref:hypothetical protein n=1 Tax=Microbacterium sp. 4R-513 TaxID=2567934 RepID=UPI001F49A74B|nr:hypothetical protein [Microbacterium sp. 4R-513]